MKDLYAWGQLTTAPHGDAADLPSRLEDLLRSDSKEAASEAYWQLDNYVVVQGSLYSSSVPAAAILCDALCEGDMSTVSAEPTLNLLYELAAGESAESEVEAGRPDLGTKCRGVIRSKKECIYRLVDSLEAGIQLAVLDLLDLLEPDRSKFLTAVESIEARSASARVTNRVVEILSNSDPYRRHDT